MAKQTGLFKFTGKLDNVIGYRRNGIHFVRSMPVVVRQTTATRQASRNFGIASRRGKLVRKAFAGQLDVRSDGTLVNRLNRTLIQSGLQGLKGYRFNRHTGIEKFFSSSPVLSESGMLHIPAQELSPLPGVTGLEVKAIAVRINFAERRVTGARSIIKRIDMNRPFEGVELDMAVPGKGTLIIALQVRACKGSLVTGDRRLMAADVIAVTAPVQQKLKKPTVKNWWPYREVPALINRVALPSFALQRE
jgi:hypothetical protein